MIPWQIPVDATHDSLFVQKNKLIVYSYCKWKATIYLQMNNILINIWLQLPSHIFYLQYWNAK